MKKILSVSLCSLAMVFLLLAGMIIYLGYISAPVMEGLLRLPGLRGSVHVYRDENGVPHIAAREYDNDAFFALGFVHAQDRFWQMEFQRRAASGSLSEIFGKKTLEADEYLRTLGFYRAAQAAWPSFNKQTQEIVKSYTAGINAFIQQGIFPLEITLLHYQPKRWTVIDSIAWQKMMAWNLQRHSWLNKLDYALVKQRFGLSAISHYFPDYPDSSPTVYASGFDERAAEPSLSGIKQREERINRILGMNEAPGKGSNGWVLASGRTTTGKPLLANDVHLSLSAPSLWYLVELRGPGLHVTGATIPGLPAVAIGHNEQIAWGLTNGYNDAADLYVLKKNEPLVKRDEIISVRFGKPVHFSVLESQYGPVVNAVMPQLKASPEKIALKWTALMPGDTTIQSFIEINYAADWQQFEAALKDFVAPTQTFLYADRAGNIGFYYPGRLPLRRWKSLLPVTAEKQYQWHGFIPFQQLPHQLNPASGLIATANNKMVADNYPYSLNARWPVPPYRIEQILHRLHAGKCLSLEDMAAIQADDISSLWLQLKPYLLQVKAQTKTAQIALDALQRWTGKTDRADIAPTLFAYWINAFEKLVPEALRHEDKIIEPLFLYRYLKDEASQSDLQKSFDAAIQKITADLGSNPLAWRWGRVHQAEFMANGLGKIKLLGGIWNRSIETSGGAYTVNVGTYDPLTLKQISGAIYREIIDLSDFDNSLYIVPMGQSGNPFSRHYEDLLKKWRDVKYVKIKAVSGCAPGKRSCLILQSADSREGLSS
ncbi:penicillin acylase family protein [Aquicella lusitana]|uniref:Penicillin amidase n=1 Tax=Aquicella lusitana TaxID=254246 RepID=A0A370H3L6_9COXI|nr:penicillin acylase family protein [Aquicella lusitana]RDI48653.1 penicillin amidase [Aquicella lusitana]VVC73970.1 Penicillin acylase 2 [Aquicella lusitana]